QLSPRRVRVERPQKTRELHRDRRPALAPAMADIGDERTACEAIRIETRMPPIPTVLAQEHCVDEFRRHVLGRDPKPIAVIAREHEAEQPAATVIDSDRGWLPVLK